MSFYRKIYTGLIIIFLCLPAIFTGISYLTGKSYDVKLVDNSGAIYEYPIITPETYFNGKYQEDFEVAWNNTFQFKGVITKTYNQIRYSLFNLCDSPTEDGYIGTDIIIGTNKDLFEYGYIGEYEACEDYYDYSRTENVLKLQKYCEKLGYISSTLEKMDKHLIFWFTSNKCDYAADSIPVKFRNENNVRAREIIFEALDKQNVRYVDSKTVLSQFHETPIYYKTGIHWARPAEQYVCVHMLNEMEKAVGRMIPKIKLTDMKQQSTPYWRDTDLWDLLNIWEKAEGTYYEYTEEVIQADQPKISGVLIQGGSYTEGLRQMILANGLVDDVPYINYGNALYKEGWNIDVTINEEWENLDIEKYINSNEIIIIEMTDTWSWKWSSGFVDYLYEYLLKESRM